MLADRAHDRNPRRGPGWPGAPAVAAMLLVSACTGSPAPPETASGPASSGTEASSMRNRYEAARRLVVAGLASLGDDLVADGLMVRARGTLDQSAELQGRAPGTRDPVPFSETLAIHPETGRVAWEYRQERIDGTSEWVREIYRGPEERLILVLEDGFSVLLRSPRHRAARHRLSRRLPPVLLRELLESPTTLHDLGPRGDTRAVAGTLADGTGVTLLLDPETGLPRAAETLVDVPGLGDSVVAHRWDDYRPVEGGLLPHRYGVRVDGRPYTDMEIEAVERGATVEAFFTRPGETAPPDEVELPEQPDPAARASVREVAPGVYVVVGLRTGFHLLFVETAEGIVAVDAPSGYPMLNELPPSDVAPAPSSSWLSERYLELIHDAVPGRPVTAVVLTHFHGDHAGGLRAFVAAGAEIIAAPSAVPGIEALLQAPHTLGPDPLGGARPSPQVRVVDGSLTLGDGDHRVEVIDVGSNPHTEHMLVVHLPAHGILYVADLLTAAPLESFPTASHASLDRFFVSWLMGRGLAPERVYTSHGSLLATQEHLARVAPDPAR